eukprot:754794-Hanusia_phi.AAC.11
MTIETMRRQRVDRGGFYDERSTAILLLVFFAFKAGLLLLSVSSSLLVWCCLLRESGGTGASAARRRAGHGRGPGSGGRDRPAARYCNLPGTTGVTWPQASAGGPVTPPCDTHTHTQNGTLVGSPAVAGQQTFKQHHYTGGDTPLRDRDRSEAARAARGPPSSCYRVTELGGYYYYY